MTFQFDSIADFMAMSGHGPYVWACYVLVFGGLFIFALYPKISSNSFKKQYRGTLERESLSKQRADEK